MKAAYLSQVEEVQIKKLEVPTINEHEVLIKVRYAGICGSDVHAYYGHHPFRKPPMVLGHEVVGEIVKLGSKVEGFNIGDRVTVEPLKGCKTCVYCLEGNYNICKTRTSAGTKGWTGTMAEYFLAPSDKVYVLPDTMKYELGLLTEPLAVGVRAVSLSRISDGENVLIIGSGPIGLLTGVAAQAKGAGSVYCTDLNDFRLDFAKDIGLQPINVSKTSIADATRDSVPDGFDIVFLAVTSKEAIDQALKYVKNGGIIVVIAIFSSEVLIDLGLIQEREIEVKGSMVYQKSDFDTALSILSDRKVVMEKFITHKVQLEEVNEAIRLTTEPNNNAIKIVVSP